MRLCLNTSCLCNPFISSSIPVPDKVKIAAAAGFQEIELWIPELDGYVEGGGSLTELKKLLDGSGLTVPSLITQRGWMDATGAEYDAAKEECRRRFQIAQALGAPRMVASPSGPRQPEWYHVDLDFIAGRYRELIEIGSEFGVVPMMEFLGFFASIHTLEQCQAIVELADHPAACMVLDPFHLWRGGSGFGRLSSVPLEQIGVCHFNDAPASNPPRFDQGDADRVWPGEGVLPLTALLKYLADLGYERTLSLELFNPGYWELDPAENAKIGMAKVKACLAEAGLE